MTVIRQLRVQILGVVLHALVQQDLEILTKVILLMLEEFVSHVQLHIVTIEAPVRIKEIKCNARKLKFIMDSSKSKILLKIN